MRSASGDIDRHLAATTLYRTDPARNMRRFYRLDVQPDLFGGWNFVREWGRVGQPGQVKTVLYPTEDAAQAALALHRRRKECKGYREPSAPKGRA